MPLLFGCFGATKRQVHPSADTAAHAKALLCAEKLLKANSSKSIQDFYSLGPEVGRGAFANVVHCTHKETGSKYACKIAARTLGQQDRHSFIVKEIAIMRQIGMHPITLSFYDAFQDENSYYIVMELCTGGELFNLIINKELTEKQVAQMMWSLMDFLAFMHSKGITHRDLKPENILMSSPDKAATIRVIDFGTADFCGPDQRLFQKFGTVLYVAPEVLGNAGHQCSCDVWSAGIILYILLAGYPPFNGASERSILNRIKKGQYTFAGTQWDSVSAEAKQAIKKMLVLKPSKRATAAQMVHSSWFKDARSVSNRALGQQLVHRLCAFAATPLPQRLALLLLAHTLPELDVKSLKEAFWHNDKDRDGKLSIQDVQQTLGHAAMPAFADEELAAVFIAADMDSSNHIEFAEFVAVMIDRHVARQKDTLTYAFRQLDQNKDGCICADDLTSFLTLKGIQADMIYILNTMQQLNCRSGGRLDLAKFKALLQGGAGSADARTAVVSHTSSAPPTARVPQTLVGSASAGVLPPVVA